MAGNALSKMTAMFFNKRYAILPRAEIGRLRFLLEGYDGLAFARTLDQHSGLVEVAFAPERVRDVDALLSALAIELGLREVDPPERVPPL